MESVQDKRVEKDSARTFDSPLSQSMLNIENKTRGNLLSWRGQFSPQLVEALLKAYAPSDGRVLDPFIGSGTVLSEAGALGLEAIGTEVNPAAAILSYTYTYINKSPSERESILEEVEEYISGILPEPLPLFNGSGSNTEEEFADSFFSDVSGEAMSPEAKRIFALLAVTSDYCGKQLKRDTLWSTWHDLRSLIEDLPESEAPIAVALADARRLPLGDRSVDFVLTSPPYINVFNYHQNYRSTLEGLGWKPLKAARSEIGANRKFRQNRFLTVAQYCLDLTRVLNEIRRVVKSDAKVLFVVGRQSNVKGTPFFNSEILKRLASVVLDYEVVLEQERVFQNRYGKDIFEDVLHLRPSGKYVPDIDLAKARSVASSVLEEALNRADEEVKEQICSAQQRADTLRESPSFAPSSVKTDAITDFFSPDTTVMFPTPHYDKLQAALENEKVPDYDYSKLEEAVQKYRNWIETLENAEGSKSEVVEEMVEALEEYKRYIDLELIYKSQEDFLYRQKGQIKLDNTIIEEFLPRLVHKAIPRLDDEFKLGPQNCFSSLHFKSTLLHHRDGGGPGLKHKAQDFAISRQLLLTTAHKDDLSDAVRNKTYLGYATAECKTNLDKTMFQEAAATANDLKSTVPGAKYFLLCEWLDMTPASTASTDIDEVLVLRKAKRISSSIRGKFSTYEGRQEYLDEYKDFLDENTYKPEVFERFIDHIIEVLDDDDPEERVVLSRGYF